MVLPRLRKEMVKLIPASRYWIGDDSTPNAGPRHLVTLQKSVWIDIRPVTVGDIQKCIMDGGLIPRKKLPLDEKSQSTRCISVDGFFRYVLETTCWFFKTNRPTSSQLSLLPACGLLWEEAKQVCEHFHARLPTEVEWEIALGWIDGKVKSEHPVMLNCPPILSKLGCHCYAGVLPEWTGSGWTNRYWPGSEVKSTESNINNSSVSVRGCLPTAKIPSQFARLAINANDESEPRIFRRAWDLVGDSDAR